MALWQYTFYLIPNDFDDNVLKKDEDGFIDFSLQWENSNKSITFFDSINNILKKGDSWSKNLYVWGHLESNALEVLLEDNKVVDVSFRVDYTSDYQRFLETIIEFCNQNGLVIINESLQIMPLNYLFIESLILNSSQFKKYNFLLKGTDSSND